MDVLSVINRMRWTEERIVAALQWWNATYGEAPAKTDWNPHEARWRFGDEDRARCAERLIAAGTIPWFTTVVRRFGSWNAALEAAGLPTRANHGGNGNQHRRKTGGVPAT